MILLCVEFRTVDQFDAYPVERFAVITHTQNLTCDCTTPAMFRQVQLCT
jgi:hypothetical protein